MATHQAQEKHKAFRDDCIALLAKHGGTLSSEEMLALGSHLVGQLIALQDQRTTSKDKAIRTVLANIELGNQEALAEVMQPKGQA